jgi:hypothetical protein
LVLRRLAVGADTAVDCDSAARCALGLHHGGLPSVSPPLGLALYLNGIQKSLDFSIG